MSQNAVSPILQARISNANNTKPDTKAAVSNTNNNAALVNTQAQNNNTKKINKKVLISTIAAAGISALAIGGMIYFRAKSGKSTSLPEAPKNFGLGEKTPTPDVTIPQTKPSEQQVPLAEPFIETSPIDKAEKTQEISILDNVKQQAQEVFAGFKKFEQEVIDRFKGIEQKSNEIFNHSNKVQQEAQKLQQEASELFADSRIKQQYDEVLSLIQESSKTNFADVLDESGNIVRKFETQTTKQGRIIPTSMQEFKNGVLNRQTTLWKKETNLTPKEIKQYKADGTSFESFKYINGNCTAALKGQNGKNGDIFYNYIYTNQKTSPRASVQILKKNVSQTAQGETTAAKQYRIVNNSLQRYTQNLACTAQETQEKSWNLNYSFNNGVIQEASKGYDKDKEILGELYLFDNQGKINKYWNNVQGEGLKISVCPQTMEDIKQNGFSFDEKVVFQDNNQAEYFKNYRIVNSNENNIVETFDSIVDINNDTITNADLEVKKEWLPFEPGIRDNYRRIIMDSKNISQLDSNLIIEDGSLFANVDKNSSWNFKQNGNCAIEIGQEKFNINQAA